jgi:hypothetical protein
MKQEEQEEPIVYKVQLLEELSERQQRLLRLANEIIDGKNQLIELYELETELYKKQNKRLTRSLFISAVLFAIVAAINIARLLV